MKREEGIFGQCNGRNSYLIKSHAALKALKLEVEKYLKEKKRKSDERVRLHQATSNSQREKKKLVSTSVSGSDTDSASKPVVKRVSDSAKVKDSKHGKKELVQNNSMRTSKKTSSSHGIELTKGHDGTIKERRVIPSTASDVSISRRLSATSFEKHVNQGLSKSKVRLDNATGERIQDADTRALTPTKPLEIREQFSRPTTAELKYRSGKECVKPVSSSPVLPPSTLEFLPLEEAPNFEVAPKGSKEVVQVSKFYGKKSKETMKDVAKVKNKSSKKAEGKHSLKLSSVDWLSETKNSAAPDEKKRYESEKKRTKSSSSAEGNDPIRLKASDIIDKVSCTSVLPGSSSSRVPSSFPSRNTSKNTSMYSSPKKLKLSLTSGASKQFSSTGEATDKTSATSTIHSSSSHKRVSHSDLKSELFGSDDEDFTDIQTNLFSLSQNPRRRQTLDSSDDSNSSGNDCFIVGNPTSNQHNSPVLEQGSPCWSSDDDDWSAIKMSFEKALCSGEVSTKSQKSNSKNKISSSKVSSKRKVSIEEVISREPSVKLSRCSIVTPVGSPSQSDDKKSLTPSSSSRKDSGFKKKDISSSARAELPSHRKGSISSPTEAVSDAGRFTSACSGISSSRKEILPGSAKASKPLRVSPAVSASRAAPAISNQSSKAGLKHANKGLISSKSRDTNSPSVPPGKSPAGVQNQDTKTKKGIPEAKSVPSKAKPSNVQSQSNTGNIKPKVGIVKKKEPPPLTSK